MKTVLAVVGGIAAFITLILGLNYLGWATTNYFSPKYEQTRNDTFKNSAAYNDGMVRDLEEIQMQYQQATPAQKDSLRALALHRFSVYPQERMTPDQRLFYNQLKAGQ